MHPPPEPEDDTRVGGPFRTWMSWAHAAVTIGLATMLFNIWHDFRESDRLASEERLRMETRIVILEQTDKRHEAADVSTVTATQRELTIINSRLDAQRDDIRELQRRLTGGTSSAYSGQQYRYKQP